MIDWWSDTEHAVVDALACAGPMSPQDLAQRVGISEGEAIAYLCMLAKEKKVAIQLGGLTSPSADQLRSAISRIFMKAIKRRRFASGMFAVSICTMEEPKAS